MHLARHIFRGELHACVECLLQGPYCVFANAVHQNVVPLLLTDHTVQLKVENPRGKPVAEEYEPLESGR